MTEAARNRWFTMIRAEHGPGGSSRGPRARRGNGRAAALILLAEEPHYVSLLLAERESNE
jgi:hypothetical protein